MAELSLPGTCGILAERVAGQTCLVLEEEP